MLTVTVRNETMITISLLVDWKCFFRGSHVEISAIGNISTNAPVGLTMKHTVRYLEEKCATRRDFSDEDEPP
jgi:hypothetical protein